MPSVGRSRQKYKVRETSEEIVGSVTGSLTTPRTLLLGRFDTEGRLQYVGRTTLVEPELMVGVGVDVTPDASGR
ncbi:hypothetical protein [Streptomyces capoamus]|uniref:hypothetical protein n=1 Tax=Streptomyces capoamus TaxID=68183 RepID=UPI003394D058